MTATFDWSSVASGWETHADHAERSKEPSTAALLSQLALSPGERVLELGAGTGQLGLRMAGQVGPTGSVLVTDVAEGMVAIARDRTASMPQIRVERVNAAATGLPADAFDVVVFCMGLMFLDDPAAALTEMRRVLATGGRLGIEVWAGPEHNPWLTCIGMAAMVNGLVSGGPPTAPGGLFSLADPQQLHDLIARADFADVAVEEVETLFSFPDFDTYFATVTALAGPLAAALAEATPEQREAVRATAADLAGRHATPDGLRLPGRALVAVGVKR